MTPEAKNLPSSITNYGEVEPYEKEQKDVFEPEQPPHYDEVLTRAVVKPLRLGHHAVRDGQGKSVSVETGRGKKLKRPLPEETPVAVLTDMQEPDMPSKTVRLSALFADWEGGIPVNTTVRNRDISPALKRKIINARRRNTKIIS